MIKYLLVLAVIANNLIALWFSFGRRRAIDMLDIIVISLAVSVVIQMFFTFYMWNSINDGKSPLNPIMATALHLIPIFNFIWTFILFSMYPKAFNDYVDRRTAEDKSVYTPYISSSLFNLYIILCCATVIGLIIPFINILISLAILVVYIGIIITTCGAIEEVNSPRSSAPTINARDISIMP